MANQTNYMLLHGEITTRQDMPRWIYMNTFISGKCFLEIRVYTTRKSGLALKQRQIHLNSWSTSTSFTVRAFAMKIQDGPVLKMATRGLPSQDL